MLYKFHSGRYYIFIVEGHYMNFSHVVAMNYFIEKKYKFGN